MSSRGRLLWLWLCFFAFLKSWEKTDFSNATTAVSFHSNTRALPLTNQIASCKHPERVRWALVWFSIKMQEKLIVVASNPVKGGHHHREVPHWSLGDRLFWKPESPNFRERASCFLQYDQKWVTEPKTDQETIHRGQSWGSFYHRRLQNHCVCSHAL